MARANRSINWKAAEPNCRCSSVTCGRVKDISAVSIRGRRTRSSCSRAYECVSLAPRSRPTASRNGKARRIGSNFGPPNAGSSTDARGPTGRGPTFWPGGPLWCWRATVFLGDRKLERQTRGWVFPVENRDITLHHTYPFPRAGTRNRSRTDHHLPPECVLGSIQAP